MNGSVDRYETSAGIRWRYRIELPPDPATGRRRQQTRRSFRTKREADRARRDAVAARESGALVTSDKQTFAAYLLDEWLPSIAPPSPEAARHHRGTVSATTHARYRDDLARYVIPRIGAVLIHQLAPEHLESLYDDLERAGGRKGSPLSPKTVANIAGTIHKALADAVRRGGLPRNSAGCGSDGPWGMSATSSPGSNVRRPAPASVRWPSIPQRSARFAHTGVGRTTSAASQDLRGGTGSRTGRASLVTHSSGPMATVHLSIRRPSTSASSGSAPRPASPGSVCTMSDTPLRAPPWPTRWPASTSVGADVMPTTLRSHPTTSARSLLLGG